MTLYGDCLSGGLYEFGSRVHLASGVGRAARELVDWFASTAIGRKITQAMMVPVVSFAVQTGAMTVMDETLAKEAPAIEAAMVETMSRVVPSATQLAQTAASEGVVVLESEISVAAFDTLMANAARGTAITTEELVAETAARWNTVNGGGGFAWIGDAFFEKLANGLIACEDLPLLAQAGQTLLEMGGYELSAFSDADGFTGSGGGSFDGSPVVFDDNLASGSMRSLWRQDRSIYPFDANGVALVKYTEPRQDGVYWYSICHVYNSNGKCTLSGRISVKAVNGAPVSDYLIEMRVSPGVVVEKVPYPITDNAVPIERFDFEDVQNAITSFFENGGQLVGNDAQVDGGGNIVDYGNADITPSVYDDNYNPDTWAQVLADAGINPVQADAVNPSSADEIVAGNNQGQTVGDVVGRPTPGSSGSPVTVPRLQMQLDGTMLDLSGRVSDKFPFSIPFNVSKAVNMLVSSPEAPHFTWVFALPTGTVEYVVDLAPFSPVANVLRIMLDVALVFVVISLLGKIAQVWGFFDKAAD